MFIQALLLLGAMQGIECSYSVSPVPNGKTSFSVVGWVVSASGAPTLQVSVDGMVLWTGQGFFRFPGVAERFPGLPDADKSGFQLPVDPGRFSVGRHKLRILAVLPGSVERLVGEEEFTTLPPTASWKAVPLLLLLLVLLPAGAGWLWSRWDPAASPFRLPAWTVPSAHGLVVAWMVASARLFPWLTEHRDGLFACMANWDGQWYLQIAREGYAEAVLQRYAYFPLYPLLLKGLLLLPGPVELWGTLVNLSFLGAAFWILGRIYPEASRGLAVFALLPFMFFLPALYTEALFLFLAVSYTRALREDRPLMAFLAGVLAGLTRVNALLLLLLGAGEMVRGRWKRALVPTAGPAVGMGLWCAYLAWTTGDPLKFLHAQAAFGRITQFHTGRLWDNLWAITAHPAGMALWEFGALEVALVLGFALLFRKRWAEGLYGLAIPLYPLGMMRLISMNRYVLMAFPSFILAGELFRPRWLWIAVLAAEMLLLGYFAHRFALQYFVG